MLIGANGVRINVIEEGDGEPAVFLHAGSCDWQMWRPQAEALSSQYRCVMWDARGHGRSDTTFGPYSYAMFAHDLYDVLTALGLGAVHLVGLSLGGTIAMQFACDYPDSLATLTLMSTTARGALVSEELVERVERVTELPADELDATLNAAVAAKTVQTRPEVMDYLRVVHSSIDPLHLARMLPAFRSLDLTERLRSIAVPTLVIHGAEDVAFTSLAAHQHIVETIPGAELEVLADAGHMVNMEQPEQVNALLEGHWKAA